MVPILHYAPDNASLCVRLALEAADLPYRTALVDRRAGGQKAPAYIALNPHGLIPTLETADGPIFETAAILLWITENGGETLIAAPGSAGRGAALGWLAWLSNTLHPALRQLFYPDQYIAASGREALVATIPARIGACLDTLESARPPCVFDRGLSLHACYLAPMLRWLALYPQGQTAWYDLGHWPRLHDLARALDPLPAVRRAAVAEGLGPTPFSDPSLPTPPEGSAT